MDTTSRVVSNLLDQVATLKRTSGSDADAAPPQKGEKNPPPDFDPPAFVSGLFEYCCGVADVDELEGQITYWRSFGFCESSMQRGTLGAAAAEKLYGVKSRLTSVRLFHADTDHGLIRLMCFHDISPKPHHLKNLRALGARWGAQLSSDLFNIHNHAVDLRR